MVTSNVPSIFHAANTDTVYIIACLALEEGKKVKVWSAAVFYAGKKSESINDRLQGTIQLNLCAMRGLKWLRLWLIQMQRNAKNVWVLSGQASTRKQ